MIVEKLGRTFQDDSPIADLSNEDIPFWIIEPASQG
jgi:hypothetical protein